MNPYQDYIAQLKEDNRDLRQEMFLEKPGSRVWLANQQEIRANMEEIRIMEQLIATDITELEKAI